jgi:hypothetical protein
MNELQLTGIQKAHGELPIKMYLRALHLSHARRIRAQSAQMSARTPTKL